MSTLLQKPLLPPPSQLKKKDIPPIQPFSPQEISKFTALDLSLRSHPELAREGASLGLNPRALAKLVHGMKGFQDAHLGRVSFILCYSGWVYGYECVHLFVCN